MRWTKSKAIKPASYSNDVKESLIIIFESNNYYLCDVSLDYKNPIVLETYKSLNDAKFGAKEYIN